MNGYDPGVADILTAQVGGVVAEPVARQLRLLPAYSPLVERFGAAFFRSVPPQPGVYLMRDDSDRLIYVGKAKNLRHRLGSYRSIARASRKTLRLIHAVRRIDWEVCACERDAMLRENALLRQCRPRFNRVGTWPRAYRFVVLHRLRDGVRLELAETPGPRVPVEAVSAWYTGVGDRHATLGLASFGAFKPGVTLAFGALLRLLWLGWHPGSGLVNLPRALLQPRPPRSWDFAGSDADCWHGRLHTFLDGVSAVLLDDLALRMRQTSSSFEQQMQRADSDRLGEFFERVLKRHAELRRGLHREGRLTMSEELDDLLVQGRV